jgi:addiction module RelE/StbE family toxin
MRLRWTAPAAQDLYTVTRYIRRDNPNAAREVAKTIYEGCESLITSPHRGRKGKQPGTRELVFSRLKYIAVYRVMEDAVEILHIWHAAQKRPSKPAPAER